MSSSRKTFHSKSRNGCLRCKTKKTKCDERRPACARCEDRGFRCPGYALNVRWSQKHQMLSHDSPPSASSPPSPQQRQGPTPRESTARSSPYLSLARWEVDDWQSVDPCLALARAWDLDVTPAVPHFDDAAVAIQSPSPYSSLDAACINAGATPEPLCIAHEQWPDNKIFWEGVDFGDRPGKHVKEWLPASYHSSHHPAGLFNLPTALSEYFFREVISLYCTWDSESNAMRSIVRSMWQSSGAMHHTIQSMAAACLSGEFPQLSSVALDEHVKALELLQSDSSTSTAHKEGILLTYMFLGHTSSWLHPQNLATNLFRACCNMVEDIATAPGTCIRDLSFFSDTMDYWAMLLVYLTDSHHLKGYHRRGIPMIGPTSLTQTIEPHPYSGISRQMVHLLTDTGSLIFQYRKRMSNIRFMAEEDLDVFRSALREARQLEKGFLAYRPPQLSQIKDPGDPKTPLEHLKLLDEAYTCTGLLQLYRVFPDLLNERYAPWCRDNILHPPGAAQKFPTAQERHVWLSKFAMHILAILREIPFESRTRSVQPFILVAVSSELRRTPVQPSPCLDSINPESNDILWPIDPLSIEVVRARQFVSSRLAAYTHILPLRKIQVIFELVKSVWSALDAREPDVYWLDVAREKNLGTMMG